MTSSIRLIGRALVLAAGLLLLAGTSYAQRGGGIIIIPPNFNDFVSITAGNYHTCATRLNGKTYCWGLNSTGQVGTSNSANCTNCVSSPKVIVVDSMVVDAGADHTCSLSFSGVASCWGNSNYGQLGIGFYGYQSSPLPVTGGLVFSSLSAGQYSTCGTTASGMFCWGAIVNSLSGTPAPTRISTYAGYNNVTVGYLHACARDIANNANCWGGNRFGQVGIDPLLFPIAPFTLTSSLGASTNRMSTQVDFTCGDKGNGTVQCTGYNGWGQLGNGNFTSTHVAQTVAGAASGVTTGTNHACALNAAGAAVCWGNGNWGQLGNGSFSVRATAQAVAGGRTFRAVAAGYLHSCGIGTDNHIYCWGDNRYGQLGVGGPGGYTSTPVQAVDAPL